MNYTKEISLKINRKWLTWLWLILPGMLVGQDQNVSMGQVFDGEPFLAINPNDAEHVVIAWMGWVNLVQRFKIKSKTSFDGGATWSEAVELLHTVNGYSSADPCVEFNLDGDVYICYIDFTGTTPPVTGGIYICKSVDGGLSWGTPQEVIDTDFDGDKWPIDRPWMVLDKSNTDSQGDIYISSFNLNRTNPSFRPYLSCSRDDGMNFSTRYLDTIDWFAGSLNPFPMCSPGVSSSGVFYGIYPSFVLTQSLSFQLFLVSLDKVDNRLIHKNALVQQTPANSFDYPSAKKGGRFICNPANDSHLAFIYLDAQHGDLDVFLIESLDEGNSWTEPVRINDDPIANNRMQDMVWADFDLDGDLVISWRDRRNGMDSTYQTDSEFWASFRSKDSLSFDSNFQLTSELVAYDAVLEEAGNDFMCVKVQDDVLYASWGDTRNGKLNIWFQRMTTDGNLITSPEIIAEEPSMIALFPNPTTEAVSIQGLSIRDIVIRNFQGEMVKTFNNVKSLNQIDISLANLNSGVYFVEINSVLGAQTKKLFIY